MVYTEDRKPLKAADWVIIAFYFLACILVGLWVCVLFLKFVKSVQSKFSLYFEVFVVVYVLNLGLRT